MPLLSSLRTLTVGYKFELGGVTLPSSPQTWNFGYDSNQSLQESRCRDTDFGSRLLLKLGGRTNPRRCVYVACKCASRCRADSPTDIGLRRLLRPEFAKCATRAVCRHRSSTTSSSLVGVALPSSPQDPGEAGLGGVAYGSTGAVTCFFSEPLDAATLASFTLGDQQTIIYALELMAVVVGLPAPLPHPELLDVIVYCDNEAALAALIKGSSDDPLVAFLLERLLAWEDATGCSPWFERVPSLGNPADPPSRGEVEKLQRYPRRKVDLKPVLQFSAQFCKG